MEKQSKKFKLAIIASDGQVGIDKIEKAKLTQYFDYELIRSLEQTKSLPSCTEYVACFVLIEPDKKITHIIPAILEELVKHSPKLVWIHTATVGVDSVLPAMKILKERKIILTNSRSVFNLSLAEYVLLSILYFTKQGPALVKMKAECKYVPLEVKVAHGVNVAIIGYGSIGKTTGKLLKNAINAKIYAITHSKEANEEDKKIVEFLGHPDAIPEVLSKADYVVNILPSTSKTAGLFNMGLFKKMKKDAVFINIGRGKAVVESDLIEALKTGVIRGAALDVYEKEPLPATSPLYDLENTLISPHIMSNTPDGYDLCIKAFEENLMCFVQNKPFDYVVNYDLEY